MQGGGNVGLKQVTEFAARAYQELKEVEHDPRPLIGVDFAQFQQMVAQSASSKVSLLKSWA